MSAGQHVGAVTGGASADDDLRAAEKARAEAMRQLTKPRAVDRGPKHDIGNGDRCPLVPEHGRMFVLKGGSQYCAHRDHDGYQGGRPGSRAIWPTDGLAAEVAVYTHTKEHQDG